MKIMRAGIAALVVSLVLRADGRVARGADAPAAAPFYAALTDPAAVGRVLGAHLAAAQQKLDQLLAVKGPRTVENTLRPYDDASFEIAAAEGPANVITNMHPDAKMRDAADAVLQRGREVEAAKLANRAVYDALLAIDASRADEDTRYYLARELAAFRREGVDRDAATRQRLEPLRASLTEAIGEYRRNVREMARTITVADAAELDGLPQDFIARHKPGVTGAITLRADGADMMTMAFAKNESVRKRLFSEATNIGYPDNVVLAKKILTLRWKIAHLLGFASWAEYDASSRMVATAANASAFMDRVVAQARPGVDRDYSELLRRKQQDVPSATTINAWEYEYYREQVRKASYDFDSQSVRPYFAYDRVRQGLLDVAARMFGVTFRPAKNVPVWHPSVEVYEMLQDGELVGRIYFDAHPREGKQNLGGLTAMAQSGFGTRQVPEAVIQASLPGGQPGDPGLLRHEDVRGVLFHEFGHAINNILAARQRWFGLTRVAEADFNETVSLLFEDLSWDPGVLATFARHYQTNEPIPPALVARMRRASEFAKGMYWTGQLAFARFAFDSHERDPDALDVSALMRDTLTKIAPWLYADGNHREASFTHFANTNYMSAFYSYVWSLAIAKDLLGQFDQRDLLAPGPAHRLRDLVMKRGGSKPAAAILRDFLGRPFDDKAWSDWINKQAS